MFPCVSEWQEEEERAEVWSKSMPIPCRQCTDENGGIEVTKPLSAFTVYTSGKEQKIVVVAAAKVCRGEGGGTSGRVFGAG